MTLTGIDPKRERPGLWRDFIRLRPLRGTARLLSPLQTMWALPYGIYLLFRGWYYEPYLTLGDTNVTYRYGRKVITFRYAEIEIVVAAYRTAGYVKQSNYRAYSYLEFHYGAETLRFHHQKRVGLHEKALRKLVEYGVRIEATRNDLPSRFGRKVAEA